MAEAPDTTIAPNDIDLTDLDTVKAWLHSGKNPAGNSDDGSIQLCITAASRWWLSQTSRGQSSGINLISPFVEPCPYNEWYDGSGSDTLAIKNDPIRTVTLLTVGNITIVASTQYGLPGYVIDQSQKFIRLRGGGAGSGNFTFTGYPSGAGGYFFAKGIQNVNVQYTAGFDSVPEDVQRAVTQQVAMNYKRKGYADQSSVSMASGAGTTSYRNWKIAPEVQQTLQDYKATRITTA